MKTQSTVKNRLLIAASPLLRFLAELGITDNSMLETSQLEQLHNHLSRELLALRKRLRKNGLDQTLILATSYCLCSCLDEMMMNSKLCQNYDWSKNSLLSITHNETWGGENFYRIYDHARKKTSTHWELIELIHLLINFGYKGKLYNSTQNGVIKKIKLSNQIDQDEYQRNDYLKINLKNESRISAIIVKKILYASIITSAALILLFLSYYNHRLKENSQISLRLVEKL